MNFNSDYLLELLRKDLGDPKDEIRAFRSSALMSSILKKYVSRSQEDGLHTEAIASFVAINDDIRNFRLDPSFITSSLFLTWRDEVYASLHKGPFQTHNFSLSSFLDRGKCGPGASLGCSDTSFYTKMFESPLTCTRTSLYRYYNETISARWQKAEETRQSAFPNEIVRGSRLSTVPKDCSKNRTICTEPTLNMFYQLGAKSLFEDALLKHFNINIRKGLDGKRVQADINKNLHAALLSMVA